MTERAFSIGCSIFVAGAVLALGAANTDSLGQNDVPSSNPPHIGFAAGMRTHDSHAAELEFPQVREVPAQGEIEIPAPTRGSFMANWDRVNGATGYLLDVSTNGSFSSYLDGYHDLDVGNVTGRVVTGLNPGTTYYYRVHAYNASGPSNYSETRLVTTVATTGLIIHPTFDTSITGNPNAAAIEATINRAISIYESLFNDPITIQIYFRYAATAPNGTPLPHGTVSRSDFVIYTIPWGAFVDALRAWQCIIREHQSGQCQRARSWIEHAAGYGCKW
jgi:hypothetical protein